ncbi:hypothetical protein MTO96_021317 [Rhipicephalus appendiculatus]
MLSIQAHLRGATAARPLRLPSDDGRLGQRGERLPATLVENIPPPGGAKAAYNRAALCVVMDTPFSIFSCKASSLQPKGSILVGRAAQRATIYYFPNENSGVENRVLPPAGFNPSQPFVSSGPPRWRLQRAKKAPLVALQEQSGFTRESLKKRIKKRMRCHCLVFAAIHSDSIDDSSRIVSEARKTSRI